MAEALAVAASGITVVQITAQVGKAVVQLRRLWNDKDVPDHIADLMEQIECLDPMLWEAEHNLQDTRLPSMLWNDAAATRSTQYCRKALKALTELADELSALINNGKKRRINSIKVVLRKDSLLKLENRLTSAVRVLTLAQQTYLVALTRIQPDIIVQKFVALTSQPVKSYVGDLGGLIEESRKTDEPNVNQQTSIALQSDRVRRKSRQNWSLVVQLPSWISTRCWEVQSLKATGNWQLNLRAYTLQPRNSQVFRVATWHEPNAMQMLLDKGLASPYDRDERGRTLLHYAASMGNFAMIRYLLSIGLGDSSDNDYKVTVWYYLSTYFPLPEVSIDNSLLIVQLMEGTDSDVFNRMVANRLSPECRCQLGLNNIELWTALLPHQCPFHRSAPLGSRLQQIKHVLLEKILPVSAAVLKSMLQPEWDTSLKDLCALAHTSRPLIILMALGIARYFNFRQRQVAYGSYPNGQRMPAAQSWKSLAVGVISHTPDLHAIRSLNGFPLTALQVLIRDVVGFGNWIGQGSNLWKYLRMALQIWLESLTEAGVDLGSYGKREKEISDSINPNWRYFQAEVYSEEESGGDGYVEFAFHIIDFQYGPNPTDWNIFMNEPTDEFAGDFWALIEDPPLQIPGSWVE